MIYGIFINFHRSKYNLIGYELFNNKQKACKKFEEVVKDKTGKRVCLETATAFPFSCGRVLAQIKHNNITYTLDEIYNDGSIGKNGISFLYKRVFDWFSEH